LPSSSLEGVCRLILFPLFATGINDAGGKFAASIVDTGGKFATDVNNTSRLVAKFATGVVDTDCAPWLANISANFRKNSK
jgi:hypothetical protein